MSAPQPVRPRNPARSRRGLSRKRHRGLSLQVWARQVVRARMDRWEKELGLLQKKQDADTIHDVRVAGRRLRSALRHLEPCLPAHEAESVRLAARKFSRLLGEARDLDILVENVNSVAGRSGSPLTRLAQRLMARRDERVRQSLPEARLLLRRLPLWRRRLRL